MNHEDHMPMNHHRMFLRVSHCKCSVDINGGEFINPNIEKNVYHKAFITINSNYTRPSEQDLIFKTNSTESPPISIDLVRTTVLLI